MLTVSLVGAERHSLTHGVSVLGGNLGDFASQGQVVSFGTEGDGHPTTHQDKRKDIAVLP